MAMFSLSSFSFLLSLSFTSFLLSSHILFFSISTAFQSEVEDESPFTYAEGSEKGPAKWGQIDPNWQVCNSGKMQSPIDIPFPKVQVSPDLGKLKRDYKPSPASIKNRGHDISVSWKEEAGKININGTYYELLKCHWHCPSEHTLKGTRYEMELHIVHMSSNDEAIAVTGILYKYGRPDPFLAKLLEHIKSIGKEEKELGIVNPGDIKFGSRKYYRYMGSLTTPPCTEGVVWTVLNKVRTVSREQVKALRDAVHDGFEANARPIQPLYGRSILFYTPKIG
ncbi:alpha carbonic anhydrase 4-like [Diospyros lotus]|uniref:alpha carbonic anhydrase 4-like n=1 Tax=Diospyros lotus TaxID=55363 RepID=UPI002255B266|nr:alpha carbonic anhydrase 4-like [Diospyros lotus]